MVSLLDFLIIAALVAVLGMAVVIIVILISRNTATLTARVALLSVMTLVLVSVVVVVYRTTRPQPAGPEGDERVAPSAALTFPASVEGTWEGRLQEEVGDRYWMMRVSIKAGSREAVVEYPGFCVGSWSLVTREGPSMRIRERITSELRFCDDPSTVILTAQSSNELHLSYLPDVGTYQASAILRPAS